MGKSRLVAAGLSTEGEGLGFVMLFAVLDDSGTHAGSEFASCSGVVSAEEDWAFFEAEWRKRLEDFEVASFHSKRFFSRDPRGRRVGAFRSWSDEQASKFLDGMLELYTQMEGTVIGGTVSRRAFGSLPEAERRFLTGQMLDEETGRPYLTGAPTKPFMLALRGAVDGALAYAESSDKIQILLDQNSQLNAQAATIVYAMSALGLNSGRLVPQLRTASSEDLVCLQLADLSAWLLNRCLSGREISSEQEAAIEKLMCHGQQVKFFDADAISRVRSAYPSILAKFDTDL